MGLLADSFPESIRNAYSYDNLELGSVLKLFDSNAQKYKWHVVVGFNDQSICIATVRINSEKNLNVFKTDYLKALCYHIKKKKNNFLNWDSFVDCSKLIEWETEKVREIITSNPINVLGQIETYEFDTIRSIIATADTISKKLKKKYGFI